MKTARIRKLVREYLATGEKMTTEILGYINENSRHGSSTNQLGNVLSGSKEFKKTGRDKFGGMRRGSYYYVDKWGLTFEGRKAFAMEVTPSNNGNPLLGLFSIDDFVEVHKPEIIYRFKEFEDEITQPFFDYLLTNVLGGRSLPELAEEVGVSESTLSRAYGRTGLPKLTRNQILEKRVKLASLNEEWTGSIPKEEVEDWLGVYRLSDPEVRSQFYRKAKVTLRKLEGFEEKIGMPVFDYLIIAHQERNKTLRELSYEIGLDRDSVRKLFTKFGLPKLNHQQSDQRKQALRRGIYQFRRV